MYVNVRSVGVGRVRVCTLCTSVSEEGGDGEGAVEDEVVYYQSKKRELNRRLIYECRCDEKRKTDVGLTYIGESQT